MDEDFGAFGLCCADGDHFVKLPFAVVVLDERQEIDLFAYQIDFIDHEKARCIELIQAVDDHLIFAIPDVWFVFLGGVLHFDNGLIRTAGVNEVEDQVHTFEGVKRDVDHIAVELLFGLVDTGCIEIHDLAFGHIKTDYAVI